MMTAEQMFKDTWHFYTPTQRKALRRIAVIGENELKPALDRLSILCEHCVATNQQEVLFECGLIDYSELQLINEGEGWDMVKSGVSGLAGKAKEVAKRGVEKVRRPPQKGEFTSEEEIKELFTFVIMQHEGTDVNSVKDAMGGAWDDAVTGVKGVGTGIKNTGGKVMQAMKAVNAALDKVGNEVQKLGVVEDVDRKVDQVLKNFKEKHQDGKLVELATKIGDYAREHPVKAALPIVLITMATTLAAGPGLLPIAVGLFLRTGLGMVKNPNEKLSSSLGSAAKVTALGMGLGAAVGEVIEMAFPDEVVGDVINPETGEVVNPDWLEDVAALGSAEDLTSDQAKELLTYHKQLLVAQASTEMGNSDAMAQLLSDNPNLTSELEAQIATAEDAIKQLGGRDAIMAKIDPAVANDLNTFLDKPTEEFTTTTGGGEAGETATAQRELGGGAEDTGTQLRDAGAMTELTNQLPPELADALGPAADEIQSIASGLKALQESQFINGVEISAQDTFESVQQTVTEWANQGGVEIEVDVTTGTESMTSVAEAKMPGTDIVLFKVNSAFETVTNPDGSIVHNAVEAQSGVEFDLQNRLDMMLQDGTITDDQYNQINQWVSDNIGGDNYDPRGELIQDAPFWKGVAAAVTGAIGGLLGAKNVRDATKIHIDADSAEVEGGEGEVEGGEEEVASVEGDADAGGTPKLNDQVTFTSSNGNEVTGYVSKVLDGADKPLVVSHEGGAEQIGLDQIKKPEDDGLSVDTAGAKHTGQVWFEATKTTDTSRYMQ